MPAQTWNQVLAAQVADGTAIANTVTETVVYAGYSLPAHELQNGRRLRFVTHGKYSNTGTPTLRFRVRLGGVSGTVIADSGAITTPSGVTNQPWRVECVIQQRANGAAGVVIGFGVACGLGSATGVNLMTAGGATAPATASLDLTAAQSLVLTAEWGTASASNTLLGMDQAVESMN